MASISFPSFLAALRQHRLLSPEQLAELAALQQTCRDPAALANELLRRGWLTSYQVERLQEGEAEQLVLGSYVLLQRLGEGGMGQVFKAQHRNLRRVVAIKLIRKERLAHPDAVRRFEREVRAAAALSHPHIVRAYDADQIGDAHLLVMEYIEGACDLSHLVQRLGPLPVSQACAYIRQAALGLQHAFERGMVHRDIKPHNLLLTADGCIKVLDMGLARLTPAVSDGSSTGAGTMTQEGAVMGTPDYIAPEQALDSHTVDIRADIYALGCTLYYLLAGRVPFPGGTLMEKLLKHRLSEPVPLSEFRRELAPEVAEIVARMMAKRPENRYQSPAEVAAALEYVADGHAGAASARTRAASVYDKSDTLPMASSDSALTQRLVTLPQRLRLPTALPRPVLLALAGGGALLALSVALVLLLGGRSDKKAAPEEDLNLVLPARPRVPSLAAASLPRASGREPPRAPPGPWLPLLDAELGGWWKADNQQPPGITVAQVEGEPILCMRREAGGKGLYVTSKRDADNHHAHLEFRFPGTAPALFAVGHTWGPAGKYSTKIEIDSSGKARRTANNVRLQDAVLKDGDVVATGVEAENNVNLPAPHLVSAGAWNRLDLVRLDDRLACFVNGRPLAVEAELRELKGDQEKAPGKMAVTLHGTKDEVQVRRVALREINALPPELLEAVSRQ